MNLPTLEPIVWKWGNREGKRNDNSIIDTKQGNEAYPPISIIQNTDSLPSQAGRQTNFLPLPDKSNQRHDYFDDNMILRTHYPGIPELN